MALWCVTAKSTQKAYVRAPDLPTAFEAWLDWRRALGLPSVGELKSITFVSEEQCLVAWESAFPARAASD